MGERGEAAVGVVLAEEQAIFGTAGEHAVRFVDATGDEVVDQYTDVGLIARQDHWLAPGDGERGVGAGDEALGASFFVAGGAVNLAGQVEAVDFF